VSGIGLDWNLNCAIPLKRCMLRYNLRMSVFDEKKQELDQYEFMMGTARGRLAVTMDCLTDALTMVGQHGVYCQSSRQPGLPAMDIQVVMKSLNDAKELVISVMEELKAGRPQ